MTPGSGVRSGSDSQRAVVTGAGSGIGRATAEALLEQGWLVLAIDIREDGLNGLRSNGAEVYVADLGDPSAREAVAVQADGFDALINAAGVMRLAATEAVTEADWDAIFSVNAKALFFLCQAFARGVADGGRIINIASVAARTQATPETCVYAASKAAVLAITHSFAYALGGRGVCVNAVLPGIVDTPMQEQVLAEISRQRGVSIDHIASERLKQVPLGRTTSAEECARVIAWLLGPDTSYLTGQAIAVDGGFTMV